VTSASSESQHIGPYRLLGRVGAGGMGVVYRVQHRDTRQVAAIKVFRPARFTKQLLQRFHTEVEALSRLRHPGICRIYEVGTATTSGGPAPYLVMELVEGRSLAAHAHENKMGVKARVELMLKLCDAVDAVARDGRTTFDPWRDAALSPAEWSQIVTLPATIASLVAVERLELYGSNLVRLPREIGAMVSLRSLDAYTSYRLHWYPYELTRCTQLVDSKVSKTGVTINTYERAGEIKPGSFEFDQPTEAELERRERLGAA